VSQQHLRTFRARTLPEAMRQLRAELGDEAVIVASGELADGGAQVTAAVGGPGQEEDDLVALLAPAEAASARAEISAALAFHGVRAAVAGPLEAELGRQQATVDAVSTLAAAFARHLRFEPLGLPSGRGVVLVGPPSAGKTAVVARLAAGARLAGRPVAVRSTDTGRAGGLEQLRALLAPLRLAPESVPAGREVASVATGGGDPVAVVIVDTAGVNPFRAGEVAGLAGWLGAAGVEPVLVLPVGLDPHDAVEIVGAFAAIGVRRCLFTRLDAAPRLGAVVAAGATGVALAEVSVSPLIGKPLLPLSPAGLARLLLRHNGSGRDAA
jgi:flagellar biosynthesis protein FlhF